jgi:hypothetical protein
MKERKLVKVAKTETYTNGCVLKKESIEEYIWMIKHDCGRWTREKDDYCTSCGEKIVK